MEGLYCLLLTPSHKIPTCLNRYCRSAGYRRVVRGWGKLVTHQRYWRRAS